MAAKRKAAPTAPADVADLVGAIQQLRDEVRVLRESIDEFRTDFVHLLRNLPDNLPPPYQHLTTLATAVEDSANKSQRLESSTEHKKPKPPPGRLF